MTGVVRSGVVAATPIEVWAALADFGAIVAWAPNVDHSCLLTEQGIGVGSARRIQTGRTTIVETVTRWTPPTDGAPGILSYALAGLPKVVRSATNTWQLEASPDGTAVTLTSTIDAGSRPPQRLIATIVGRILAAASAEMIAGLTESLAHHPASRTADTEVVP